MFLSATAGHWMPEVGEPDRESAWSGPKDVADRFGEQDRAERKVAAGDAFRGDDDVGSIPRAGEANQSPVRPNPVTTSSAMSRIPHWCNTSRTRRQ